LFFGGVVVVVVFAADLQRAKPPLDSLRKFVTQSTALSTATAIFLEKYQASDEKGVVYGLSWYMTGITVMAVYARVQTTIAERMMYATVWWMVKREMMRPARKRKTEM
jgi:hypothetical protein